jgi:hypothetical protein
LKPEARERAARAETVEQFLRDQVRELEAERAEPRQRLADGGAPPAQPVPEPAPPEPKPDTAPPTIGDVARGTIGERARPPHVGADRVSAHGRARVLLGLSSPRVQLAIGATTNS